MSGPPQVVRRALARCAPQARTIALAVRHHYMLGVTAVVLAVAAAGGLGYFDEPEPPRAEPAPGRSEVQAAAFVAGPAPSPGPAGPFEFNVYLVYTVEQQQALQVTENQYRSPYLLDGGASIVLLVRTAVEELYAAHHVEEVRLSFPGAKVIVTDLR